MTITITRIDGGIRIFPVPPYITDYLVYHRRDFVVSHYRLVNRFQERLLYSTLSDGSIVTYPGFFTKIQKLIQKNGDTSIVEDMRSPLPTIDWEAVKKIGLRDYQVSPVIEFLTKACENNGIVCACGGWGKTQAQMITYAAFSKLNTILAVPLKEIFKQTYNKFVQYFPNKHVGRVGNGYYDISNEITISTFKSLENCALEKCQLLLVDEIQGTTGDKIASVLSKMKPIRVFGYTATDKGLFNKADKLITGFFGERLIYIPYEEGERVKAVVPGLVYIVDVPDDIILPYLTLEAKILHGIKQCKRRNQLIAEVCNRVPNKWQTLIFVDHIKDHLVQLYREMPAGTRYLHRDTNKKTIGSFALSTAEQEKIIEDFKNNKFQFLIATDAFKAGVDIPNCRVIVQASGGSSEIEVLQEAFRASRILTKEEQQRLNVDEKTHFVLIDFMDNHDEALKNMSLKRIKYYESQGWKIKRVKSPDEIDWFDYK